MGGEYGGLSDSSLKCLVAYAERSLSKSYPSPMPQLVLDIMTTAVKARNPELDDRLKSASQYDVLRACCPHPLPGVYITPVYKVMVTSASVDPASASASYR